MPKTRILYLTDADSKRLAAWLELIDVAPAGINPGRYEFMRLGTKWISHAELATLTDTFPPYDGAGVIRGAVTITTVEEIAV